MKLKNLIILTSIFLFLGAGNPDKGQDKVAVCSACHGSDGNSVVGLWPSLAGQNEKIFNQTIKIS
jgi:cytochrome c553